VPDAAGEVALEAAQCFAVGLAFGAFAFEVGWSGPGCSDTSGLALLAVLLVDD
jgi:hypothetical protein